MLLCNRVQLKIRAYCTAEITTRYSRMLITQNYVLDEVLITPLALILAVLVAKSLLVPMPGVRPHYPFIWRITRRLTGWLEARLNREYRRKAERAFRGFLSLCIVMGVIVMPLCLGWLYLRDGAYGLWFDLACLALAIGPGEGLRLLLHIRKPLENDDLPAARRMLRHVSDLDTTAMDNHGLVRKSIEIAAAKLNRQVVAPVFWYWLAGLPGLLISATIAAMDSAIGQKAGRHPPFGQAAARLDDALNLVPARLTALLIVLASIFTATAGIARSFVCALTQAGKHKSVNGGWPLAAMAGALDLALAGPYKTTSGSVSQPWIGPKNASAKAKTGDIKRAALLYTVAFLLVIAGISGYLRWGFPI